MLKRFLLLGLLLFSGPAHAGIELNNDGFSRDGIVRAVTAPAQFPAENFTVTWAVYHDEVDPFGYKSYWCICHVSFCCGDEYAIAFAANPNVLGHGRFGIGSQGNDTYTNIDTTDADEPVTGRWYYMAFQVRKRGTNDYEQLFYYDLPNLNKVISRNRTAPITPINSNSRISFGTPPYADNEGVNGVLANFIVYDFAMPAGKMFRSASTWQVTDPELKRHVWGQWPMRHTGDLKDISGHGRHLAFTTLTNAVGNRGHAPGAVSWREWSGWWPFDGPANPPVEGCYLMENNTDFYLMENNADFYALEGGDGGLCTGGGGGGPVPAGFKLKKYEKLFME